mgnify:CR=1 FL=1
MCQKKSRIGKYGYEAFALNELCQFSGAFCNSLHCDEMGYLCRVPYRVDVGKSQRKDSILIDHQEWDGTASLQGNIPQKPDSAAAHGIHRNQISMLQSWAKVAVGCVRSMIWSGGNYPSENCRQRKPPGPDGGRHPGDEACVGDPGCLQRPGNLSKTDEAGVVFERLQQKLLLSTSKFIKFAKTLAFWKKVLYSNQASVK